MNEKERLQNSVEEILRPILEDMDAAHVETVIVLTSKGVRINLILYRHEGITLDNLVTLQKAIRPRLELEINRSNLTLEVSSPGMNRVLKSPEECNIFLGREVKALQGDEWYRGVLERFDNKSHIALTQKNGSVKYVSFEELKKVVLD